MEANLPPKPTVTSSPNGPDSTTGADATSAVFLGPGVASSPQNAPSGSPHMASSFGLSWVVAAFMFLTPGALMLWL